MISIQSLRHFGTLTGIGEENLHEIAMISDERRVAAGTILFEQGAPAARLFLISSGEIDIMVRLADGERVVVDTIVAGELLGWSSYHTPNEHLFDAVARLDSTLIEVDAAKLRELVDRDHGLGFELMAGVVGAMSNRMQTARIQLARLAA